MTRTVEDAVRIFDVIAGTDPADSVTAGGGRAPSPTRLHGRFCAPTDLTDAPDRSRRVRSHTRRDRRPRDPRPLHRGAPATSSGSGATVVRDFMHRRPRLAAAAAPAASAFATTSRTVPRRRCPDPPHRTLAADRGERETCYRHGHAERPSGSSASRARPRRTSSASAAALREGRFRDGRPSGARGVRRRRPRSTRAWNNPPRLVGDLTSPHGNNSPILSRSPTGFPGRHGAYGLRHGRVSTAGGPADATATPGAEPILIRIAYAYEQGDDAPADRRGRRSTRCAGRRADNPIGRRRRRLRSPMRHGSADVNQHPRGR